MTLDNIRVCTTFSGSSHVQTSLLQADADRVVAAAALGPNGVSNLVEVSDPVNGRVISVPQPINIWLILGVAIGGFLVLLVIILAIYFCCKQCKEKKSYADHFYVPMAEKNARSSEAAQYRPVTSKSRALILIVVHDCNHQGEGVLHCREGLFRCIF